jgi:hypothetical protein
VVIGYHVVANGEAALHGTFQAYNPRIIALEELNGGIVLLVMRFVRFENLSKLSKLTLQRLKTKDKEEQE